ncbi:MAG TPA: hypothetical protein VGE26_11255 [Sphingobacteriaceae bacterium]
MKKTGKFFAAMVMLLFILPNLAAVIIGRESYPFTPAPMFAHYIGDRSNFYDFAFIAEGDSLETAVVPKHPEHRNELAIKRFFFDRIYGSVERNSPLWSNNNDDRNQLETRLNKFFSTYFKDLDGGGYKRIRLEVKQYDHKYAELASHTVGVFDLSTKHFTHTWSSQ